MHNVWAHKHKQSGFTIVELLIVIVVIGVLAAIVILAYNGIQQRARVTAVTADLVNTYKKLAVYQIDNSAYPVDLTTAGITTSGGSTFQYSYNNAASPQTYCVTATNGNTSYNINQANATPQSGGCAGHGVGGVAAVTNLSQNPSIEADTSSFGSYFGGSISRVTSPAAIDGVAELMVQPSANTAYSGFSQSISGLTSGTVYTVSFYIYRTSNTETLEHFIDMVGATTITVPVGTWTKLSRTFTYSSNGNWGVRQSTATAAPSPFYIDKIMYTSGSSAYNYADGNSLNWVWNGSANISTSTGPPV